MRWMRNEKSAKKDLREFIGEYIGITPLYSRGDKNGEIKVVVKKGYVKIWVATEGEKTIKKFPINSFRLMPEKEKEYLIPKKALTIKFPKSSIGFFSSYHYKGGYPKLIFSLEGAAKENEPVLLVSLSGLSEYFGLASLYNSQKKELHEAVIAKEKLKGSVFRLCSA